MRKNGSLKSAIGDLRDNVHDAEQGAYFPNGRPVCLPGFDPYFARWIQWLHNSGKSHHTEEAYANGLAKAVVVLGEIEGQSLSLDSFSKLKPDTLRSMTKYMRRNENASDGSLTVRYAAIRSFAKYLHAAHNIPCNDILLGG